MATERTKNAVILAGSFLIGILILIGYLVISRQYGNTFRAQETRFNNWTIHNIPIWAEFVLSVAGCVVAITISFFPMRLRTYYAGLIAMIGLMSISEPSLDSLPGPWSAVMYLLTLVCVGTALVRQHLEFAPALRTWNKAHGTDPDEFRWV